MNRRDFIKAAGAVSALTLIPLPETEPEPAGYQQAGKSVWEAAIQGHEPQEFEPLFQEDPKTGCMLGSYS